MITETRAREERRTQAAPVDLEHGRFEPGQVLKLWGIAASALAVGSAGGLFISWGSAASSSHWRLVASAGLWLLIFGILLTVLSYAVALAISLLATRGWWQHQQRVEDWHYAQLAAYEAAGGQESNREVLQRTLDHSEPAHALLVALHVVQQAREGIATPWSSPKLADGGGLWYNGVRLGNLSKTEAEEFSRLFGAVGLVHGRRKGHAGQLAVAGEAEALKLVAQNWSKFVPGRVDRTDEER